jgi:hypothetical protein
MNLCDTASILEIYIADSFPGKLILSVSVKQYMYFDSIFFAVERGQLLYQTNPPFVDS